MPTTRADIHRNVVIVLKPIVRCIASPKTYRIPLKISPENNPATAFSTRLVLHILRSTLTSSRGAVKEAQEAHLHGCFASHF